MVGYNNNEGITNKIIQRQYMGKDSTVNPYKKCFVLFSNKN